MKKIYSLLTALVLCASTFAATYTFYYGVPDSKTYTPYIWVTNEGWSVLTSPAHQAMTYLGMNGDVKIYKFELESNDTPRWIIFTTNDGWSGQSGNVTATDHGYYFGGNNDNCTGASTTADAIYASDNAALGLAPSVVLSPSSDLVMEGETISLLVTPQHFSGTPSYTYSYSTDGGASYTSMGTDHTLVAGAPGTVYKFKVEASYNTENAASEATVKVVVCSVVGTTNLTGYNWDTSKNDMEYDAVSGVFTWTKKHVSLPVSDGSTTADARFKIVVCHEWGIEFPSKDYGLTIADADYYDVVITFNWADREETGNGISVTATKTPLVSLAADKAYALAGNTVALTATPTNFTGDILYTYSYKVGEAEYVKIAENVASATYNWILPADVASGTYSIKVDAACAAQNQNATSTNTVEVKVAKSWTVGGSLASVFGVEWADNAAANHMVATENDGVYTLTKSKVFIPANTTLEYKVFKDDANAVSYGKQSGGNQDYYFENAGYYDIVFTFNWGTEVVTASHSYICPKVEMKASFYSDWAEVEMETALNNESCSLTYPLLAGPYNASFMISVNDGAWVGYDNTITRTDCANWTLNDSEHPCSILADVDGDYTFTYDFSDGKIDVLYPNQIVRSAGNTNFQSLCVPFNATIENAKAYTFGSVNGSAVVLTEVVGNLVAGGAYIIQPESNDDVVITMVDGATLTAQNLEGAEGLYGVLGNSYTYIHDNDASWEVYVLQSDNKFHLISDGASATIKSTKAYLHLESAVGNAPSQLRIVLGENNTTGVENIEANEKTVKFFENGQLFILRDGVVYDATGRAVR